MNVDSLIRLPDATPMRLPRPMYCFELSDFTKAITEWGMNCGPGALCTMLCLPPDRVRKAIPDFDKKRYTSPTMMKQALNNLGVRFFSDTPPQLSWQVTKPTPGQPDFEKEMKRVDAEVERFPIYGLARIQFTGPWNKPGVPPQAAYQHTHWVGSMVHVVSNRKIESLSYLKSDEQAYLFIFDVNFGWQTFDGWARLLPSLIKETKRADGGWHVTHRWQLELETLAQDRQGKT
jgi:hypothetical protein